MTQTELKKRVSELDLEPGHYVLFGGCTLCAYGLREATDIDLFVSHKQYEQLKKRYGGEAHRYGQTYLIFYIHGIKIEAHAEWLLAGWQPDFAKYMRLPEIIDDLPLMPLKATYDWKAATARKRDLEDVQLINTYWSSL